jgi:outer membrane protein assembly factor BamB
MLLCALMLCTSCPVAGQEWCRFRGPNGAGESDAATIAVTWTAKDYNWRVGLPGIGHSSPVVWGERIFITAAIEADATRIVQCLKTADGSVIWKTTFPGTTYKKNRSNSYAAATPPVDQDRLYTTWVAPEAYLVLALDCQTGREVWRRDLGPFVAQHGFGASPILFGDLLIVPNDQDGKSFVVALDRKSGEIRWQADRRSDKAAYSTPCIFQPEGGSPQLILTSSAHGINSLDPQTGKTNWELDVLEHRVVGSPMIAAGLVIAGCGEGGGGKQMLAARPADPGKNVEAKVMYNFEGSLPYVPIPVACGRLVFLWSDSGVVTCADAPTGKIHWRERVGGKFYGSPVRVRDRLYCMSREGEMFVLAAADQYKLLGQINLEEPSHCTPVVAAGTMYLRTFSHLMSLGGKKGS